MLLSQQTGRQEIILSIIWNSLLIRLSIDRSKIELLTLGINVRKYVRRSLRYLCFVVDRLPVKSKKGLSRRQFRLISSSFVLRIGLCLCLLCTMSCIIFLLLQYIIGTCSFTSSVLNVQPIVTNILRGCRRTNFINFSNRGTIVTYNSLLLIKINTCIFMRSKGD